jgi:tetratricopeptide (TPR) repeat protein
MTRGGAELVAREYERAEETLREAWEELGRLGEGGFRSTTGTYLAEALVRLGRVDEALRILTESEAMTAADDWVTVAHCAFVRGLASASTGDDAQAAAHMREAVEAADEREYFLTQVQFRLGLGEVLVGAGRTDEARPALEEAAERARLKGATVYEERALELLTPAAAPPASAPRRTSPA